MASASLWKVPIFILRGRHSTLDVSCWVFLVNRLVIGLREVDNAQIVWQAWDIVRASFYTVHFTLHTLDFTLHTRHFTLYTVHFTLDTPHFTIPTSYPTCCIPHSTLHCLHYLHTPHSALHPIPHSTVYTGMVTWETCTRLLK